MLCSEAILKVVFGKILSAVVAFLLFGLCLLKPVLSEQNFQSWEQPKFVTVKLYCQCNCGSRRVCDEFLVTLVPHQGRPNALGVMNAGRVLFGHTLAVRHLQINVFTPVCEWFHTCKYNAI